MATRYYAALAAGRIYFRSTRRATAYTGNRQPGEPAYREIDAATYRLLLEAKQGRIAARHAERRRQGLYCRPPGPRDSWVEATDVTPVIAAELGGQSS